MVTNSRLISYLERRPKKYREEDRDYSPSPERAPSPDEKQKKKKKDKNKEKEKEKEKEVTKTKDKTLAPSNANNVVTNVRPSEATAIGGLLTGCATRSTTVVDLTNEEGTKMIPDSKEISFSKLQGRTFPSLVVVARPNLRVKDPPPNDRAALDGEVKSVLMLTPMKFTEWLIKQGLVRNEQWCTIHAGNKLRLGMYSDVSKFPHSGGYVWISECCPTRFVSVFASSIFEGATFPPSVILKLIYHWACQTNVQNVVQWMKVDNLYVKGLFTWLRAICLSAIHEHMGVFGGGGKKVEVGVISLGTTSHDGAQRQVKVEVLGVLDQSDKLVRLRAVEPLAEHEKDYKKRFQKILEPLKDWVHPSSVLLTDLTVDRATLVAMGFKNVHQSSSHGDKPAKNSNANIMEYLRRIVPRMFQNTLSLLSRQIIQQFLDELVWREKYGISTAKAFDNIMIHIAEQTKIESKDKITIRLNKIASNPFKSWKYPSKKKGERTATVVEEVAEGTSKGKRGRKKKELTPPPPPPPPPPKRKRKEKSIYVDEDDDEQIPLAQRRAMIKQEMKPEKKREKEKIKSVATPTPTPSRSARRRAPKTYIDDDPDLDIPLKVIKKELKSEETVSMEKYYFGQAGGSAEHKRVAIAVQCPICKIDINNNCMLMRHIFAHVSNADQTSQCLYCLHKFADNEQLQAHLKQSHPKDTKCPEVYTYACLICEVRFAAVLTLASHMQKTHCPLELPYACGACDYRASSHRATLDHFLDKHARYDSVICPICLKVTPVYLNGEELSANVAVFVEHMRNHEKKLEIKCSRCVLKFVHLGQMKEHQIRDHYTFEDARPLCVEEHLITKPKNKARPPVRDSTSHTISETYDDVSLVLPEDGLLCRECDHVLDGEMHFLGTTKCTKCPYVTSCYRAMLNHSGYCAGAHSLEDAPREGPYRTHCVCGYNTTTGTDMLSHFLTCEHKTAYPSAEEANAHIVKSAAKHTHKAALAETRTGDSAPPSVLNTQLSLDDLAPPSVLQAGQREQELPKDAYDRPLSTPRHEEQPYTLGDFEPLPQEPQPQPDFEQL